MSSLTSGAFHIGHERCLRLQARFCGAVAALSLCDEEQVSNLRLLLAHGHKSLPPGLDPADAQLG
jgi:hypothetical protein